ncbi:hypothetical protein NtRootA4_35230 [Arthrobacter sp. NtRootA4]|nr:hypothetical protein NtRootA2_37430 [Arthrobacter sp. NtRootA2]BCW16544.1 hypothetical protein NtRootA4_35230 [Arthrobacter sp. NtRootA4]BCW24877.1 hypothetical protein NtRootC7_37440 [Arthrobacter sp. NtRootC7]BCW29146.1 hypothetical protein NtRootC45_37460 [Arthrobacter sp. NtRootC45]BCW33416.1 hypothetical protein NtRootD5_37470 [Arthrobacter sp. NtRootD5]
MVPAAEDTGKDSIYAVGESAHRRPYVPFPEGRQVPDVMKNRVHPTIRHLAHESMLTAA